MALLDAELAGVLVEPLGEPGGSGCGLFGIRNEQSPGKALDLVSGEHDVLQHHAQDAAGEVGERLWRRGYPAACSGFVLYETHQLLVGEYLRADGVELAAFLYSYKSMFSLPWACSTASLARSSTKTGWMPYWPFPGSNTSGNLRRVLGDVVEQDVLDAVENRGPQDGVGNSFQRTQGVFQLSLAAEVR